MSDGHGKEARAAGRVKLVLVIVKADSPFALRLRVPVTTAHLEVAGNTQDGAAALAGARPGPPPCDVDVPVAAPDPSTDDLQAAGWPLRGGLGP